MGSFRRDRHGDQPRGEPVPIDPPEAPPFIRKRRRAHALWKEHAARLAELGILDELDAWALAIFCELMAEFERNPADMPASKIAQLRALATTLGLDQASRARLRAIAEGEALPTPTTTESFFD